MPFSLVYVSRATRPMDQDDLLALLHLARTRNLAAGLTGLLLYRDGTFVQLLEGPQSRVEALYASIGRDPRHHDVTTVLTQHQEHRQFPDWTMGFTDLDAAEIPDEGYSDVLQSPPDPARAEARLVRDLLDLVDLRT